MQNASTQQIVHETFYMLAFGAWALASTDARQAFLWALYGNVDCTNCDIGNAMERFEDTRSEDEVNVMLQAFTLLGMDKWTWCDSTECYTTG